LSFGSRRGNRFRRYRPIPECLYIRKSAVKRRTVDVFI
jgi:hypothetical protein